MSDKNKFTVSLDFPMNEIFKQSLFELKLEIEGLKKEIKNYKSKLEVSSQERYLSREEVKKMLGISYTSINDYSKKGILCRLKFGNRTYFRLSDIEKKLNDSNKST